VTQPDAREGQAGLAVALDMFVHHFGSRTFLGLGVDCHKQLRDNFELFRAKWGPEKCVGYRLPAEGVRGQGSVKKTCPPLAVRAGKSLGLDW
jgi:hypothetical protein